MKGTTIHLGSFAGRLAAARLKDGQLDDLLIAADEGTPLPGAIYRATVDRVLKGQGGAMLTLPDGGHRTFAAGDVFLPAAPIAEQDLT